MTCHPRRRSSAGRSLRSRSGTVAHRLPFDRALFQHRACRFPPWQLATVGRRQRRSPSLSWRASIAPLELRPTTREGSPLRHAVTLASLTFEHWLHETADELTRPNDSAHLPTPARRLDDQGNTGHERETEQPMRLISICRVRSCLFPCWLSPGRGGREHLGWP